MVDQTEVLFLWARKTVLETSLIRTKTSHAPSRDQNSDIVTKRHQKNNN